MTRIRRFVAPLLALFHLGTLLALAQNATPLLPAISIQQVDAGDATTYAMWIARSNEVIKEKLGIEKYFRVYIGEAAGDDSGVVFAVSGADSFATSSKNWQAILAEPAAAQIRANLAAIRKLGALTRLKAVRFDGTHPNAWLYNTQAILSDEAGYLQALEALRALFDSHGLQDCKINAYRVVAGRDRYSHLISINTPSAEQLAALLDATAAAWIAPWFAESAKYRTVVRNGTYREITQ